MKLTAHLRNYFLAGVVVTAPIAITIWLVWWIVSLFDMWIKPLIPSAYNPETYLPFQVPGLGLVVALVIITLIGALAANLVGRTLLHYWEYVLSQMPVVRSVYRAVKQIFQTAFSQSGKNFQQVGLIEFPRPGVYVFVFVAREFDSAEIGLSPGQRMVSAFMPTTPNPTSGYLFFVHKENVKVLDLSIEDGAKLVISAGLVTPGRLRSFPDVPILDDDVAAGLIQPGEPEGPEEPEKPPRKPARKKSNRRQEA